ncbi:hypothetical protein [Paraburkholderia nemoris]|uniref:hypothetical protein n=1 Tax=Paraburkholderia nemoris TaxID=2793076 RepID=UPI001B0CBC2D|nr:hypothetical protein [Paraburkholderia nemoris]CAE6804000.1 hypothetical protein LMG22931_05546 [Paraburkholderia nemoris]
MNEQLDALLTKRRGFLGNLLSPYTTLDRCGPGPLNAYGPGLAFERMAASADIESGYLVIQRIMPAAYRELLAEALEAPLLAGLSPALISPERRSLRWQLLCDRLRAPSLTIEARHAISYVLLTLGYYEQAGAMTAAYRECPNDPDAQVAALSYLQGAIRYILCINDSDYQPDDVKRVAERAPSGSRAKFLASSRMLMYSGRFARNLEATRYWRAFNQECLEHLPLEPGGLFDCILRSRFWRSACFLPLLGREYRVVEEELDRAESLARAATCASLSDLILKLGNLYPVLQSRNRLATMLGHHDLALALAREMFDLDPLYTIAHVDLGSALIEVGQLEKAASVFTRGFLLGPPLDDVAAYLAGHCYELLGRLPEARACYRCAAIADQHSVSAVGGLQRTAAVANDIGERQQLDVMAAQLDIVVNEFAKGIRSHEL